MFRIKSEVYFIKKILEIVHMKQEILSQLMRFWYLSHMRLAKAQSRQSIRCLHTWNMEVDKGSDQKSDI